MFYTRKLYHELKEHATKKPASIITGLRRTGKTTLMKQLLLDVYSENSVYIDLERLDNRILFQAQNYEGIVLALKQRGLDFSHRCVIALDEAQLVKELPSVIKYLYDTYEIKFIVSGSSSYYIKNLFNESLSGRKKIFELYPLDFGEYLTFKTIPWSGIDFINPAFNTNEFNRLKGWYDEFIEYGGFPEVVLSENINDKTDLLEDIISSYINIDIKWLSDFRNAENIRNLLVMLASRVGTKLDTAKISALTGLSIPTVANYIELFEQTYLIQRLSVVSKNPDREIVKARKIFFSDNGIVNRLARVSSGSLFENAVFNQLKHKGALNYYSLKNGKEIDFIYDGKIAFEVKETATNADQKMVEKLASNLDIYQAYVISRYPSSNFLQSIWGGTIK
ncbi:MAG: ATP-binding protein [Bacteroidota bacterium]